MKQAANNTLITIGITSFNSENSIERAIDSALRQTWHNKEIIIVDDFSIDNSVEIIEEKINKIHFAKLVKLEKNGGASYARNIIIDNALGKYIAFFDDDDESFENRIEQQYKKIEEHNAQFPFQEYVFCFASGYRRYKNSYIQELNAISSKLEILKGEKVAQYLLFNRRYKDYFYGTGTPCCSLMMETKQLNKLGRFDETLRRVEDIDLAIRGALLGAYFIGTEEKLFIQNSSEGTHKTAEINYTAEIQLGEKHKSFLKKENKYLYFKLWTKIRFFHFTKKRISFLFYLSIFILFFPFSGLRHAFISIPQRLMHELRISS